VTLTHLPGILRTDALLALRNVLRQRRRSLIGVAAVAFGVIALLLAAGFIEWIFWGMREGTIRSRLGHVQIAAKGYLEKGVADPFAYLLPADSPAKASTAQLPGVRTLAPRLAFSGLASVGEATLSFLGEGMDPEREAELNTNVAMVSGEGLSPADPRGIIVGWGLAENLGVKVGDTIVLLATTRSGGINAVEGRVRGLFSTVTKAYDDAALRVPLPLAQELLRVSGSHTWVLLLDRTERTSAIVDYLRQTLASEAVEVVPWYDLADFYNKTVALFSRQVSVMKLIVAIIIVLSIANVMTMSVMERTGEIGTALALGVPRMRILAQIVFEGLALGAIGGAIGVVVGFALSKIISAIGIPMPPPPGMARGFSGEILVTGRIAFDAFVLAVATALAASVYPAWKASRMIIVDALRHNR
jgi:putative ABC transport system permease protein